MGLYPSLTTLLSLEDNLKGAISLNCNSIPKGNSVLKGGNVLASDKIFKDNNILKCNNILKDDNILEGENILRSDNIERLHLTLSDLHFAMPICL